MAQFINVARDSFGNTIPEAEVTVFFADTETLATIYSDNNNSLVKPNPFDADEDGQYSFFADPGEYKIQVEKQGFESFVADFVPIPLTDLGVFAVGAEVRYGIAGGNIIVADNTPTNIAFDSSNYDDGGMVALPNIVLQEDGVYSLFANLALDPTGTTAPICDFAILGGVTTWDTSSSPPLSIKIQVSDTYRGLANDIINVLVTPHGGQAEIIAGTPKMNVTQLYKQ